MKRVKWLGSWWCVGMLALAASARAEWRCVDLTPAGGDGAAFGVSRLRQAGYVDCLWNGVVSTHAATWAGTANSLRILEPPGAQLSYAWATTDTQQVGEVWSNMPDWIIHAALWSGTAASFVDLNPSWASRSQPLAFAAPRSSVGPRPKVARGERILDTGNRGQLLMSVHPSRGDDLKWDASYLYATDGTSQVGCVVGDGGWTQHAGLWHGSAEGFVDLHPDGWMLSAAVAVSGPVQAGMVRDSQGYDHACLWRGSASSFVNLNPPGAMMSWVKGAGAGHQVGYIWDQSGAAHASIWSGTPESWVDLGALVWPIYGSSAASAIWEDDYAIYVVGSAGNHIVLWYNLKKMRIAPPPIKLR